MDHRVDHPWEGQHPATVAGGADDHRSRAVPDGAADDRTAGRGQEAPRRARPGSARPGRAGRVVGHRPAARAGRPGAARPGPPPAPPAGRPRPARPGVPARRGQPPRPEAQERRAVHHPPARRHHDPGPTRRRDDHLGRLAAPRHRRGHRVDAGPGRRRLRTRSRLPGRRGDEAGEGRLRCRRRGGDLPQDAGRHRGRRPGDGDQAGRPAAQHADHPAHEAGQPGADRQGHPGRADPAGRTARHPGAQGGAGGHRLRHPAPRGVRPHPGPDGRSRGPAGHRPGALRPATRPAAGRGRGGGRGDGAAPALRLAAPGAAQALRRARAGRAAGGAAVGRLRAAAGGRGGERRLLRGARRAAHLLDTTARGVQGLRRRAQVQPLPVAAHRRGAERRCRGRGAGPHPADARGGGDRRGRAGRPVPGRRRPGRRRAGPHRPGPAGLAQPAAGVAAGDARPGRLLVRAHRGPGR